MYNSIRFASVALFSATTIVAFSGQQASAAPVVFFGNMFSGATQFDNTIVGVSGTVTVDNLAGMSSSALINRGSYTIARINGGVLDPQTYNLYDASPTTPMSGQAIDISPSSTDVDSARSGSGIIFDFTSIGGVNGFGLEVGDWATCCQPSNLYISFDGGAPILVGESLVEGDQYLTNGGAGVFVGAIDDSAVFNTVEFWGNGLGEYLVAGGAVRYGLVDEGSITNPVPEPLTLLGASAAIAFGAAFKRKKAQ